MNLLKLLRFHQDVLKFREIATYEQAEEFVRQCGSHERMPVMLALSWKLDEADFLRLLGEWWTMCDWIGRHLDELRFVLPVEPTRAMMDDSEWAALMALPPRKRITIYRGCDAGVNETGISWSLDREVAAKFPFYMRYRAKHPVLLTATVRRSEITAIKLSRGESEVITMLARFTSVEPLSPPEWVRLAPRHLGSPLSLACPELTSTCIGHCAHKGTREPQSKDHGR